MPFWRARSTSWFSDLSLLVPHAKAGTLRLLAVAGRSEPPWRPSPDGRRAGNRRIFDRSRGMESSLRPERRPNVIAKLSGALREALQSPEVQQRFEESGYETMLDTPAHVRRVHSAPTSSATRR
jgi:tripartite-type tricarboxylate transporter receptor subunit TctC